MFVLPIDYMNFEEKIKKNLVILVNIYIKVFV